MKCSDEVYNKLTGTRQDNKHLFGVYRLHGDRGSTVVKVLCYKSEGRWFDPSWCQWIFSLT